MGGHLGIRAVEHRKIQIGSHKIRYVITDSILTTGSLHITKRYITNVQIPYFLFTCDLYIVCKPRGLTLGRLTTDIKIIGDAS